MVVRGDGAREVGWDDERDKAYVKERINVFFFKQKTAYEILA